MSSFFAAAASTVAKSVTPPEATNPALHITGDDGFIDISSNAYTITNNGATQTGTIYNGHKALSYDGSNDYSTIDGAATIFNGSYEGFLVCQRPAATTSATVLTFNKFTEDNAYSFIDVRNSNVSNDGQRHGIKSNSSTINTITDATDISTNLSIISFRYDSGVGYISTDNGTESSGSFTKTTDDDRFSICALVRNANPSGVAFVESDICEIKIFDNILSLGERSSEITNLAAKYGITL